MHVPHGGVLGFVGTLGFVPVYSTVQDHALLCPSAAGEVLAGAGDGTQWPGTEPRAPCHCLLQPSGAAAASVASVFPGQLVQAEAPVACALSRQPQHHLRHSRLPAVWLLAVHPCPAAGSMAFCLGMLFGDVVFAGRNPPRLLSVHPRRSLVFPGNQDTTDCYLLVFPRDLL